MSDITTEDCKRKLGELYPDIPVKSWKRTKKYLNEMRRVERIFESTVQGQTRTAILQESNGGLVEVQPNVATALQPVPAAQHLIAPSAAMNTLLFGTSTPTALQVPFTSPDLAETRFLMVLQNTLNWEEPEKRRSTYDFSHGIDFKQFTQRCVEQGIDLMGSYVAYMTNWVDHLAELDEETFCDVAANDYDDSLADMLEVLGVIRSGYALNGWQALPTPAACADLSQSLRSLKSVGQESYDPDDEDAAPAFDCIKTALKTFSQKKGPVASPEP